MPAAAIAAFLDPAAIEVRKTSRESGPGEMVMRAPVTVKLSMAIHVDMPVLAFVNDLRLAADWLSRGPAPGDATQ
jgi:hypothetical protein